MFGTSFTLSGHPTPAQVSADVALALGRVACALAGPSKLHGMSCHRCLQVLRPVVGALVPQQTPQGQSLARLSDSVKTSSQRQLT